ncbi:hypothetical protein FQZ97_1245420 [compost metagenome]
MLRCRLLRGGLAFGFQPRGFNPLCLLASGFLLGRLLLPCSRLALCLLTFCFQLPRGFLPRCRLPCSLLALGFQPRRFDARRFLHARRFLPGGLLPQGF